MKWQRSWHCWQVIWERKGEISNENAPFVKWRFFCWILKNIKNWHNNGVGDEMTTILTLLTMLTMLALLGQSEAISDNRWRNLENITELLNHQHVLIDASASTKWWLGGCNRDKNMLGYDQLRYIGCQRRMAPQIFTRENQSGSFSAQDDTFHFDQMLYEHCSWSMCP